MGIYKNKVGEVRQMMYKLKKAIKQFFSHPLGKSIKEFFRVVLLAIVPVAIVGLENGSVDYRVLGLVGAIAGLKFIDKLLHEVGKEELTTRNTPAKLTGLTRF